MARSSAVRPLVDRTSWPRPVWWQYAVIGCLLLFAAYWLFIEILIGLGSQAVSSRHPEAAGTYARLAAEWGPWSRRAGMLYLRTCRKQGDVAGFESQQKRLSQRFGPDRDIEHEQWLLEAQAGSLTDVEKRLSELLTSTEVDAREVSEAYANAYIQNYRLAESEMLLDGWINDFPDDPQPHFMRGRLREHSNQWDAAIEAYTRSLKAQANYGPAAYSLGRIYLGRNEPLPALEYYDQAIGSLEIPAPAIVGKAHALRLDGRLAEGEELLKGVLSLDPATVARGYRFVGDTQATGESAPAFEMGLLMLAIGKNEDAIKYLRQSQERSPQSDTIRLQLANALRANGQGGEAEKLYQTIAANREALTEIQSLLESIRSDPDDVTSRVKLGTIFLERVSPAQGLVWLHSALTLDRHNKEAHLALAKYYQQQMSVDPKAAELAKKHAEAAGIGHGLPIFDKSDVAR